MPTQFPLRRWFSGRTQCLRPLTPSMRRLTILLGVLAGAQLLFLFWLNLTQLRYHLGYDASCDYLRAAEMYRQGKLFPDHWRDTTTSHLDSPVPLAALDAGKLFAEHVLAFVSKDSEMELIPIGQLARNLLAALDGWFALLVALPLTPVLRPCRIRCGRNSPSTPRSMTIWPCTPVTKTCSGCNFLPHPVANCRKK